MIYDTAEAVSLSKAEFQELRDLQSHSSQKRDEWGTRTLVGVPERLGSRAGCADYLAWGRRRMSPAASWERSKAVAERPMLTE